MTLLHEIYPASEPSGLAWSPSGRRRRPGDPHPRLREALAAKAPLPCACSKMMMEKAMHVGLEASMADAQMARS